MQLWMILFLSVLLAQLANSITEELKSYEEHYSPHELLGDVAGVFDGEGTGSLNSSKSLAVYRPALEIISGNASYGTVTGGPSITHSLEVYRSARKRDVGDIHSLQKRQVGRRTTDSTVQVTCINPTLTHIDECLESMDKKVAETCLPGLTKLLSYLNEDKNLEEINPGSYAKASQQSETCLKYAFSNCSYDSRYNVKTKIRKLIGINLDIAFQEEFEMDCCTNETMKEVISNVQDCFEKEKEDFDKVVDIDQTKTNISTEIIEIAGRCIEDHTAFTCVLEDKKLFRNIINDLVTILRKQSLEILERLNPGKYNYTRLCLKWMDYNRLENCEAEFFEYVGCLKNGLYKPELFKRVHECFQNALKVCPTDTAKLFIKIIAGAVEGHEGEEPKPLPEVDKSPSTTTPLPTTTEDFCSPSSWAKWVKCFLKCIKPKLEESKESKNLTRLMEVAQMCASKTKPVECKFHKSSHFIEFAKEINHALIQVPNEVSVKWEGDVDSCLQQLESEKLKNCIVNLFLYYVSLTHAHYTQEAREKLLDKAKLCFQVTLKACPFKPFVHPLLIVYSRAFRFRLPPIKKAGIITRVTIPEGYVWCETRIITGEKPVPTTEKISHVPEEETHWRTITPTTTKRVTIPPLVSAYTDVFTVPDVHTEIHTPEEEYTHVYTPTSTQKVRVTLIERIVTDSLTPKRRVVTRQPIYTTRTMTIPRITFTPRGFTYTDYMTLPPTVTRTWSPSSRGWSFRVTPTTVIPVTRTIRPKTVTGELEKASTRTIRHVPSRRTRPERITPTTIRTRRITLPTRKIEDRRFPAVTEIVTHRVTPKTEWYKQVPTTTLKEHYSIKPRTVIHSMRPPPTTKRTLPPTTKKPEMEVTHTTIRTVHVPLKKVYEIHSENATTVKMKFVEHKPTVIEHEVPVTTKEKYISPRRTPPHEIFTPTTVIRKKITIPVHTKADRKPLPKTKIFSIYTAKPEITMTRTPDFEVSREHSPTAPPIVQRPMPPTPERTVYLKPTTKKYSQVQTETTVERERYTVSPEVHRETGEATTVRVQIIEFLTQVMTGSKRFTTVQGRYTPRTKHFTERQTRTTTEATRYSVKPQTITEEKKVPGTKIQHITPTSATYGWTLTRRTTTRPPPYWITPKEHVTFILPSPRTREIIIPTVSTASTPRRVVITTTAPPELERIYPTAKTRKDKMEQTTIKAKIVELPEITRAHGKSLPETEIQTLRPFTKVHEIRYTRTPTEIWKLPLPTKTITHEKEGPPTKLIEMPIGERTEKTTRIYPTTFIDYIFLTGEEIWRTIPPATTTYFTLPIRTRPTHRERQTPTTTSVYEITLTTKERTEHMTYPTTRAQRHTPRPQTRTKEVSFSTEIVTYPGRPKEYVCVYPTTEAPKETCEHYKRKEDCTEEIVRKWIEDLKNCTNELLVKDKKNIIDYIEKLPVKELEQYVATCVQTIGDTHCRNETFPFIEWVLEKEVYVAGRFKQHARNDSELTDDLHVDMNKCVALIDEAALENCYPGLHKVLTDIVLYHKHDVKLELMNPQPTECLINSLKHCKHWTKVTMEKILEKNLGKCIMLIRKEKSFCRDKIPKATEPVIAVEGDCVYFVRIRKLLDRLVPCNAEVIGEKKRLTTEQMVKEIVGCLDKHLGEYECVYKSQENDIKIVQQLLIAFVSNYTVNDDCKENFQSKRAKKCFQNLIDLALTLNEVEERPKKKLINTVYSCFLNAMPKCPESVSYNIMKYMLDFTRKGPIDFPPRMTDDGIYPTISSLKTHVSDLEFCVRMHGNYESEDNVRPTFPDECVPIYTDNDPLEPQHILVKSCSEEDVENWLKKLKSCVEEKATKVGLRDPDYLNLERVVMILMNCVDCIGPLKCRAKYQEDFKKILKTILNTLKYNSLSEDEQQCKNELNIDNIPKGFNTLHKYFALTNDRGASDSLRNKVSRCISTSLKSCSPEIQSKVVDLLELSLFIDGESVTRYFKNGFDVCTPVSETENDYDYSTPPMYCGPGGILVRKSREVRSVQSQALEKNASFKKNSTWLKPTELSNLKDDSGQRVCTSAEYEHYFDQMENCTNRRLYLKFRRARRHNCPENNLIERWTAITECMIENTGDELICSIQTEDQMTEYLQYVAETLHSNENMPRRSCLRQPRCYGTDAPELYKCSSVYLQLVKTKKSTGHLNQILHWSSKLLGCLRSVWPNCSPEVSFMQLSFVYLPLGMNYDLNISSGLKFASCKASEQGENVTYPSCMEHGNEILIDYSKNSLKDCSKCVRVKDGICSSANFSGMFQAIVDDFSRVIHCVKAYIPNDKCMEDVVMKMRNNCLQEFYRFSKSIQKGIILNSIRYFWDFNQCLSSFKSDCPESVAQFVPEIYYEILGLSSAFKPFIGMLMN